MSGCALGLGLGELNENTKGIWSGGTSQEPWDTTDNLFSLGREVFEEPGVQKNSYSVFACYVRCQVIELRKYKDTFTLIQFFPKLQNFLGLKQEFEN